MREIKFRAWDKTNNEMLTVFNLPLSFLAEHELGWMLAKNLDDGTSKLVKYLETSEPFETVESHFELMQFTGLKDKNDKDIYDGDIVIHLNQFIREVCWDDEHAEWDGLARDPEGIFDMECAEVIGNVYENPDLLK